MRSRPVFWLVVSLLSFAGAYYLWQKGEEWAGRGGSASSVSKVSGVQSSGMKFVAGNRPGSAIIPAAQINVPGQTNSVAGEAAVKHEERLKYRLSNTSSVVGELVRSDRAVLLENALIDTGSGGVLSIPAGLRSEGDPGSYIVQSRGPLDGAFRELLRGAGAQIVSYIPNNAYLVRASAGAARQIGSSGQTQAVLAYEPYYKLKSELLRYAVEGTPLPEGSALNVLLFGDAKEATQEQLKGLGVEVVGEDVSPFGPVLKVRPPEPARPSQLSAINSQPSVLVAVAGLSGVQCVELLLRRVPANDMTRVVMGVAANTLTPTNYLGLTGAGVTVAVTDSGVDAAHPDLIGRVTGDTLADTDGHGTHVAGIIASSGLSSTNGATAVGTNASGSVNGATFQGKAPAAGILSLGIEIGNPFIPESYLQEAPAKTNVFISNNSWGLAGGNGYDLTAASYDAAVRDALPGTNGSQPVLFVFSAGNDGVGQNDGTGGQADSISAPGTAKNVITVGATELGRMITNRFGINGVTNAWFMARTDDTNDVAGFSSRGNVGIGIEGDFGRFKPDVVAPGTFVVSTRSTQWDEAAYYNPSNSFFSTDFNVEVEPGSRYDDFFFVPDNAVRFRLSLRTNEASPTNFPASLLLPIYARAGSVPGIGDFRGNNQIDVFFPPDQNNTFWFFTVRNPGTEPVSFDVLLELIVTNDNGSLETLRQMNDKLGSPPRYRYESGTSQSAPAVSGMLALMQQFMEAHGGRPSPALMKALLINGARPIGAYDLQVQSTINYQGWGLANLTNSLPGVLTNSSSYTNLPAGPVKIYEQSPSEALATGRGRTHNLSLNNSARIQPLRVTLVWTDPPGNPAAGVKLVNDLDLVVTNLDTGQIYYGNDIGPGSLVNSARDTNGLSFSDVVNNVENIFIPNTLSSNYSVTVIGRRVNVNAVTAHANDVVQDYALVIVSGNGRSNNVITVTEPAPGAPVSGGKPFVTTITNMFAGTPDVTGGLLMGQHVGAASPLVGTSTVAVPTGQMTVGSTNQWHFYVFSNSPPTNAANGGANFTNVAFVTFLSQTLALPREGVFENDLENATREEADIDMYVSTDFNLTNLVPSVLAAADKSLSRGGTELIVYNNSVPGRVYYIGVKSEDRQAAEYGFFAIATDQPFSEDDGDGVTVRGLPVPMVIPDGTPKDPGVALVFGIAVAPEKVRRAYVANIVEHQLFADLLGNLSHNRRFVVLNNHTAGGIGTNQPTVYEDNGEEVILPFTFPPYTIKASDGPGSLRDFTGEQIAGLWLLTMVDNAAFQTGRVMTNLVRLEKQFDYGDGGTNMITIGAGRFFFDSVDVPVDATSLTITVVTNITNPGAGPVQLYVRRGGFPTTNVFDKMANIPAIIPPGGSSLTIDKTDTPPLNAGRYYFGFFNPNPAPQTILFFITIGRGTNAVQPLDLASVGNEGLFDDAITNSSILITTNGRIASVEVGLRLDHPRISDLAFTLVSPIGTRVLLMENRGGFSTNGIGSTPSSTTNSAELFNSGFETNVAALYPPGSVVNGWTVFGNNVSVVTDPSVAFAGTNLLALADGSISRTWPTVVGRRYQLSYAYRGPGIVGWWRGENNGVDSVNGNNGTLQSITFATGVVNQAFSSVRSSTPPARITIADQPAFRLTNSLSIEGWVKPVGPGIVILLRGDNRTGFDPYFLSMGGNDTIYFAITDQANLQASVSATLGYDQWWHVAGTLDGNSGRMRMYVNGVPQAQIGTSIRPFGDLMSGLEPGLGIANVTYTNANWSFSGQIDEISLYSRALSGAEVQAIYARTNTGKFDPLVAAPLNLAKARLTLNGVAGDFFGQNNLWLTNVIAFTATNPSLSVVFSGLEPGMLMDSVKLTEEQINSQSQYLIFTENTNLTTTPIKFAVPPFTSSASTMATTWHSSFEPSGGAAAGACFAEGWHVDSGDVETGAFGGSIPYEGASELDINGGSPGQISTNITVIPGKTYRLSFAYARNPDSRVLFGIVPQAQVLINGTVLTTIVENDINTWANLVWRTAVFDFPVTSSPLNLVIRSVSTPGPSGVLFDAMHLEEAPMQVYTNGFEGTVGSEWSSTSTDVTPVGGRRFLGQFANDVVTLTLSGLPAHTNVNLSFNIFAIRSWDGNNANPVFGPDIWDVRLGGSATPLLRTTFMVPEANPNQSFPSNYPAAFPAYWAAVETNSLGYFNSSFTSIPEDAVYSLRFSVPHTVGTVQIRFSAENLQGVSDESWGLDNLVVSVGGGSPGLYYLPEETLDVLKGERALGEWRLEVWDNRIGAPVPIGSLVSWQLSFVFEDRFPQAISLTPGVNETNIIAPGTIRYFTVDVLPCAGHATNTLVSASAPLNVYFNQNTLPTTNDLRIIGPVGPVTSGIRVFDTNAVPLPMLLPGQRYYLGLQNPSGTNVDFVFRVDFDCTNAPPPNIIVLSNAVAYCATNSGTSNILDNYVFTVSTNSVRAQFEINGPTGDMLLLVRKGFPPDAFNFDYLSDNSGTNDELIVVFTNSTPVPLSPGDWYLAAINLSGGPVSYCIKVTEWSVTGQPIIITNAQFVINNFCLTWNSLIGVHYVVQGKPDLNVTNSWDDVSPTITAIALQTTYCVSLPSAYHFFRVKEGLALNTNQLVLPPVAPQISSVTATNNGFLLQWSGPTNQQYWVEWVDSITPPITWNTVAAPVSSTTGQFSFFDDGSQTAALGPVRFYRLRVFL